MTKPRLLGSNKRARRDGSDDEIEQADENEVEDSMSPNDMIFSSILTATGPSQE